MLDIGHDVFSFVTLFALVFFVVCVWMWNCFIPMEVEVVYLNGFQRRKSHTTIKHTNETLLLYISRYHQTNR